MKVKEGGSSVVECYKSVVCAVWHIMCLQNAAKWLLFF